jgi:hypothetical protein
MTVIYKKNKLYSLALCPPLDAEAGGFWVRGEDQGSHHHAGGTTGLCRHSGLHGARGIPPHPDPPDPHVFGPPGSRSGSISQRFGSGSFYH